EEAAKLRKCAREREASNRAQIENLSAAVASGEVVDPLDLFRRCAGIVAACTAAKSCYVALVVDKEEPEPELEEDDVESDDEADRLVPPPATPSPDGDEVPQEESGEKGGAPTDVKGNEVLKFDYSKVFLEYVVGSPEQDFFNKGDFELRRPSRGEDEEADAGEDASSAPLPPTLRMLDDQRPSLYIASCIAERHLVYLRKFPMIGSYFACAVRSSNGEYKAMLCADTLAPPGNGGQIPE
ncbi:unnamed protein product, partial [Ostreobium quekettii]